MIKYLSNKGNKTEIYEIYNSAAVIYEKGDFKMKKKALAWGYVASIVLLFAAIIVSAVYYLILHPSHQGDMDLWAKIMLFSAFGVFAVLHILINHFGIKLSDISSSKKIERVIDSVSTVLGWIVVIPVALVGVIIALPFYIIFGGDKRVFKPLISKGYKFSKNRAEKCYVLTSKIAIIKVDYSFCEWLVSIDGGDFVPVVYSEIGAAQDRAKLLELLRKYESAHPVDKQRGDARPPKAEFVDFLCRNLANNQ